MKVEKQDEKEAPLRNFLFPLLSKSKFFRSFKKKIVRTFALMMVLIFVSTAGFAPGNAGYETKVQTQTIEEITYVLSVKEKAELNLTNEVQSYINKLTPGTEITPSFLVEKCQEYNMDVIFVLAQGILESHLGTKGKAAKTNSVWNVGTYDDGKVLYTYEKADDSIDPYLTLLKERYLNEKDLHNLLQDRGYTNDQGYRYASAKGYENALRKLMIKIDIETSIALYQDILNMNNDEIIAFFMPTEYEYELTTLQAMR